MIFLNSKLRIKIMIHRLDGQLKPIPLSKLEVWREGNVRKTEIFDDIEDLARNIREIGLQVPLIVWKNDEGTYMVISGQRRLQACRMVNYDPVECIVIDKINVEKARILSLSENLYRKDMNPDDISDACDFLYKQFANFAIVAEKLGVSEPTVRKYVGYKKITESLKQLVRDKKIMATQALLIYTRFPDEDKQMEIARELAKITERVYKSKFFRAIKESQPIDNINKLHTRAKQLKDGKEYKIFLEYNTANVVDDTATEMGIKGPYLISDIVDDWVDKRRFKEMKSLIKNE